MALVECVPNFSEGQRQDVIDGIVGAIAAVDGVHVLDHSSDADHNRTVVTFVGSPEVVLEAAFRGIRQAAATIDLEAHQGEHPRIGAADVVPFVPLRDITLADCAALAHRLGERVGWELAIPVYLYEAAARRPERNNLAEVRRYRYEQLKTRIGADPARAPDFGPSALGAAGAVAIGARGPLIAFNAYLDTDDVTTADAIARDVRESGGGLRLLKALGMSVNGQAQVSMNVIDFRQIGLYKVIDAVRTAAEARGLAVTHTEVVGLIPQAALVDAALDALALPRETRALILEQRLGTITGDYRQLPFE